LDTTLTLNIFDEMIVAYIRRFNSANHQLNGALPKNGRTIAKGAVGIRMKTRMADGRVCEVASSAYFPDRRIPRAYARRIGIYLEGAPELVSWHNRCGKATLPYRGNAEFIRLVFLPERRVFG
jgi:hypothetical protein